MSYALAHCFGSIITHRRRKANEQVATTIHCTSWAKCIAQEVESLIGRLSVAIRVLAVHDLGLLRVQFQFSRLKTRLKRVAQRTYYIGFAATMTNDVVGITLERSVGIVLHLPPIKRVIGSEGGLPLPSAHTTVRTVPYTAVQVDRCQPRS